MNRLEAVINGKRVPYDLCSEEENAYEYSKDIIFIGKGNVIFLNGVENVFDKEKHFFYNRKKHNQYIIENRMIKGQLPSIGTGTIRIGSHPVFGIDPNKVFGNNKKKYR